MAKNFYKATATLIGTVVGSGIFILPYVVAKAGFAIGLFFLLALSGLILLIHLFYGEVVLRTIGRHRFVGLAGIYLGRWGKRLTTVTSVFIFYGALLAYTILAGKFLKTIFGQSDFFWSLIFFAVFSLAIFFGLRLVAQLEIIMSFLLILVVGLIFFKGWPMIETANLTTLDWSYFFLPYGAMIWAIGGWAAIPEMKEIFQENCHYFKKAVIWGTLLPAFIYGIFILTVVGVTGQDTSSEAIQGLARVLESQTIVFGAIFGWLAVATSFLVMGISLKKVFWYDYRINKHLSWAMVCSVPLVAYLLHLRDFVGIIGFLGSTLISLEGIILIIIYQKAKKNGRRQPEYSLKIPFLFNYALILLFALTIIYQLVYRL